MNTDHTYTSPPLVSHGNTDPSKFGHLDLPEASFGKITYDVGHEAEDNLARATTAAATVRFFGRQVFHGDNEDMDTAIGDLMGNLLHLVDALRASGVAVRDLDELLERGRVHYEAEVAGTP